MATATISKPMTAEEFFDWVHRPENRDRWFELERGKVIEMPPPGERHGYVSGNIGRILGNHTFRVGHGYVCTNDTGVVVESQPDTVRGIDVTLYEESCRYDDLTVAYPTHLPTLAVEVLSPHDRPGRMMRRVSQFLRKGISLVWLVDAEDREGRERGGGSRNRGRGGDHGGRHIHDLGGKERALRHGLRADEAELDFRGAGGTDRKDQSGREESRDRSCLHFRLHRAHDALTRAKSVPWRREEYK